jgi:membrane-associated phospholipid phosphatase
MSRGSFPRYGLFLILLLSLLPWTLSAQKSSPDEIIPLSKVFYNFGGNLLHSVTYNYGLNFAVAALGTYALVETGFDWKYNRLAHNNPTLAYMGFPSLYIGYVVPVIMPIVFYTVGRFKIDTKLQVTGLALTQSLILSLGLTSIMKGITGRISPGIIDVLDHTGNDQTSDYSGDFAWGFGKRGFIAGWPSGHTTNAFAAAAVISEIYNDNMGIKFLSYTYAAFIGLGVSLCVHWSSEVFAGAIIGYTIGKTVGRSFNKLISKDQDEGLSFVVTPNFVGINLLLR